MQIQNPPATPNSRPARSDYIPRATKKPKGFIPWASSSLRFNSGTRLTAQSMAGWPLGSRAGRELCSTGRSQLQLAGRLVHRAERQLPDGQSHNLGSASKANDSFRSSSQLDRSRPVRTDHFRTRLHCSRWRRTRRCSVRNSCNLFRNCCSFYGRTNNSRWQPTQIVRQQRSTTNSAWCLDSFIDMTGCTSDALVGGKPRAYSPRNCADMRPLGSRHPLQPLSNLITDRIQQIGTSGTTGTAKNQRFVESLTTAPWFPVSEFGRDGERTLRRLPRRL
jgi:hypothetical protein